MTILIDLDDTLIKSKKDICIKCGNYNYYDAVPIQDEIDRLNKLYDNGNIIIIWTGRGWNCYKLTIEQLAGFGIKYHQLMCGKPSADLYIDHDSIKTLKDIKYVIDSNA